MMVFVEEFVVLRECEGDLGECCVLLLYEE